MIPRYHRLLKKQFGVTLDSTKMASDTVTIIIRSKKGLFLQGFERDPDVKGWRVVLEGMPALEGERGNQMHDILVAAGYIPDGECWVTYSGQTDDTQMFTVARRK
jgi:hypothetical protein